MEEGRSEQRCLTCGELTSIEDRFVRGKIGPWHGRCLPEREVPHVPLRTADDELREARDALHAAAARSRDPARIRAIDGIIAQVSALLPPPVVVTTPSAADNSFLMKRFTETR